MEVVFTVRPERLVTTASWMTTLAASWQERLQLLKRMAVSGQATGRTPGRLAPGQQPSAS